LYILTIHFTDSHKQMLYILAL